MNEILKFDLGSELNFCIEMEFAKEESFPYKKIVQTSMQWNLQQKYFLRRFSMEYFELTTHWYWNVRK